MCEACHVCHEEVKVVIGTHLASHRGLLKNHHGIRSSIIIRYVRKTLINLHTKLIASTCGLFKQSRSITSIVYELSPRKHAESTSRSLIWPPSKTTKRNFGTWGWHFLNPANGSIYIIIYIYIYTAQKLHQDHTEWIIGSIGSGWG